MTLARCPACQTVFRVRPEQLLAHRGNVRCGQCYAAFNALDHLLDEPAAAPPREASAAPTSPNPPPAGAAAGPEASSPSPVPPAATQSAEPPEGFRSAPPEGFFVLEDRPGDDAPDAAAPLHFELPATELAPPPPVGATRAEPEDLSPTLHFELPDDLLAPADRGRATDVRREPDVGQQAEAERPSPPPNRAPEPGAGQQDRRAPHGPARREPVLGTLERPQDDDADRLGREQTRAAAFADRLASKLAERSIDADGFDLGPRRHASGAADASTEREPDGNAHDITIRRSDHDGSSSERSASAHPDFVQAAPRGDSSNRPPSSLPPRNFAENLASPPASEPSRLGAFATSASEGRPAATGFDRPDAPDDAFALPPPRLRRSPRRRSGLFDPILTSPRLRGLQGLTVGLLLGTLAVQAAYVFREPITRQWPALRPAYLAACAHLGCDVPLPRVAGDIAIEASALQSDPARRGGFVLGARVRNRADYPQAYPYLELTLTDSGDRPLARRVLEPAEWAGKQAERDGERGFAAGAEVEFELPFTASGVAAAGYRLYVFYP